MNRRSWALVLAGVALTGAAAAFIWERSNHRPETDSAYVDSAVCGGCHQEILKSYRLTGMGRSVSLPGPDKVIEDYKTSNTLYHRASDRYYTLFERDGKRYQRRHQIGFGGKETNIVEKAVDLVIG